MNVDDLKKFCSRDVTRSAISTPRTTTFEGQPYTIATDGRIAVILAGHLKVPENSYPPPAFEFLLKLREPEIKSKCSAPAADLTEFRGMAEESFQDCSKCHGFGRKWVQDCETCGGDGDLECSQCGAVASCDECGGDGRREFFGDGINKVERVQFVSFECDWCDGAGLVSKMEVRKVGGADFQAHYLGKIAQLPCVRFYPGGANELAAFFFDGGFGAVMPLRTRGENRKEAAA